MLGTAGDEALRNRLERVAAGVPVILAAQAASAVLRIVKARRVAIVHPPWFSDEKTVGIAPQVTQFGRLFKAAPQ